MKIIFDIETGALPLAEIEHLMDGIKAPGNLKDPAKIESAIAEKRAEFLEKAALSPFSGRILAIGWREMESHFYKNISDDDVDESYIIKEFWQMIKSDMPILIGHNIRNFDIPFIVRRGWKYGISPAPGYLDKFTKNIIDTMEVFAAGEWGNKSSLNDISKFFGLGEKTGAGDDFAKWWRGGERERAIEYLNKDLILTQQVAQRMGVI